MIVIFMSVPGSVAQTADGPLIGELHARHITVAQTLKEPGASRANCRRGPMALSAHHPRLRML